MLAFLPLVVIVVFYNFVLERDRLLRAKALAAGDPPTWLIRANKLLPSSTFLFLILPGLLFAEAILFQGVYGFQVPTSLKIRKSKKTQKSKDQLLPPRLRDWMLFTVTGRIRARHMKDRRVLQKGSSGEIKYLVLGKGYEWFALLLRSFLIFFYLKRLLLIYLMLMESTYGIRVHRSGTANGDVEAEHRLNIQREILLRTLDSFPRAWAGLLLRGVQGRHTALDPMGGWTRAFGWFAYVLVPMLLPRGARRTELQEKADSRLLREEEISILGQMQDRRWVIEAFIDLVSPAHSSTFRGRLYYYSNVPVLKIFTRWYFCPPTAEVRARVIDEMATVIERAILRDQRTILLSDVETEILSHEGVWALRDRALRVLEDVLLSEERTIRVAAARAIYRISQLPRPVQDGEAEVWEAVALRLGLCLETFEETAKKEGHELATLLSKVTPEQSASDDEEEASDDEVPEESKSSEEVAVDPFADYFEASLRDEAIALLQVLGGLGTENALKALQDILANFENWEIEILQVIGLGTQASGRLQSGFALSKALLQEKIRTSDDEDIRNAALESLVRLAFPQPIAESFQKFTNVRAELESIDQTLSQKQQLLEKYERKRHSSTETFSPEDREGLERVYQEVSQISSTFEELSFQSLERMHDTFWNITHYCATILVASYIEGEGFESSPEFSDFLSKWSLEDAQDWQDFFASLPDFQDKESWSAPYYAFCEWVSGRAADEDSRMGMNRRFAEMHATLQAGIRSEDGVERWEKLHGMFIDFQVYLYETLYAFLPCLETRSFLILELEEGEETHWWRVTFTGLQAWLQKMEEKPTDLEPNQLYLAFEQHTPVALHPIAEITWEEEPVNDGVLHGHCPVHYLWGYSYIRLMTTSQKVDLHLRRLGGTSARGYWRTEEKLGRGEDWANVLAHLKSQQESRTLGELDLSYLRERCIASFRRVFARSRLREQDSLMIKRDLAEKLDDFLEQDRSADNELPSCFLLSGEAGRGKTTLVLQNAREASKRTFGEEKQPRHLTLVMNAGLLEVGDSLATWFFRELQVKPSEKESKIAEDSPVKALVHCWRKLSKLFNKEEAKGTTFCLYLDDFHECENGIELFAHALQLAEIIHDSTSWCKVVLSIRQSYLENHLNHPSMRAFCSDGKFMPNPELFYRQRGGLHGVFMELIGFSEEPPVNRPNDRSELERAYRRYFNFTDTSGIPRYRPTLESVNALERFCMSRRLLSDPSLLPVVMETYHGQELPEDLHLMELFARYMSQFRSPERMFMRRLARKMLYGGVNPHFEPKDWRPSPMLEEAELLEDYNLVEYFDEFRYGRRIYDELRSRGILIREWALPQDEDDENEDGIRPVSPVRHVTFTSTHLQEYLLYQQLMQDAPDWSKRLDLNWEGGEPVPVNPPSVELGPEALRRDPVAWLMEVAKQNETFRPLEGTVVQMLLRLISEHEYQVIADFNDRDHFEGGRNRHLLFEAFTHLDHRTLARRGGLLEIVFSDISANDLHLIQSLGQYFSRRSLYEEVDALYSLLLDLSTFSEQLGSFPSLFADLLLERADNQRRLLNQQSGVRVEGEEYRATRKLYESALEKVADLNQKSRMMRFLALFEMDTRHYDEAEEALEEAWKLAHTTDEKSADLTLNQAWIRHLQSSLARRRIDHLSVETSNEAMMGFQTSRQLGEEALELALTCPKNERIELLAQIYDNLARVYTHLPGPSQAKETREEFFGQAREYFLSSIRAKRTLNDYLGMAMSHVGLGQLHMELAKAAKDDEEIPGLDDWNEAEAQFELALSLNKDKVHSDFGVALSHQSLAELYILHPEKHAEGLSALMEALVTYAKMGDTGSCQKVISQIVTELASLPLNEMKRILTLLLEQLQNVHELSDWVLNTLWDELSSVFGERIPKIFKDFFKFK